MSAEADLVSALEGASGVTALVSTRIYPDARPQDGDLPAVVYQRAGTAYTVTVGGNVALTREQMGVGCYAKSRSSAEAVADAVQAALVAAGFAPLNRVSDFEEEMDCYIVALLLEHLSI